MGTTTWAAYKKQLVAYGSSGYGDGLFIITGSFEYLYF